jgi:peptidoglycan/xylan/chitin deacetylase (PgdA/CDA1 family)
VVLTFDDGFASVYTRAFPILARYGFPATVFLVSGYCGKRNDWAGQPTCVPRLPLLTWEEVAELDRHGIEIGAHTHTHPRLDHLPPAEAEREIAGSKAAIEEQLGHAIELFAYPYGRYDGATRAAVGRAYTGACTTRLGRVAGRSDPLAVERVDVQCLESATVFRGLFSRWMPTYLSVRGILRQAVAVALRRAWR